MVKIYAAELGDASTKVNLLNPGATRTRMRAKAMPGEDPATLPPPEVVADFAVSMVSPDWNQNGVLMDFRS